MLQVRERQASSPLRVGEVRVGDALEVVRVSPVRMVVDVRTQPDNRHTSGADAPRLVEEVRVLINHIGKVDGEFRTFAGSMLHRRWDLQRLDDGPWRIISTFAI